jgi:hypothetical protein
MAINKEDLEKLVESLHEGDLVEVVGSQTHTFHYFGCFAERSGKKIVPHQDLGLIAGVRVREPVRYDWESEYRYGTLIPLERIDKITKYIPEE